MAWPHAAEVTVDSYTSPVGFVVPGESGILTNRATGVAATIYSDRDRSLTLNTAGQVKLDGTGNLSGVFTEPGRYRLSIGVSLIDITVYPDPDDLGTGGGTPASSVTGPDAFGSPSVVGTSPNYARQDHDHGLPAGPAGSTPASSVTGPDAFGATSAVGTSTNFARQDHDHGLPAAPSVPSAASSVTGPDALGASTTVGTSPNYARQDHDHGHQSATQTAAGLLLFGTHAARPAAAAGNANLYYFETDTGILFQNQSGTTWAQIGPGPASTVTGPDAYGASPAVGTSTAYARADHDHGLSAPTAIDGGSA